MFRVFTLILFDKLRHDSVADVEFPRDDVDVVFRFAQCEDSFLLFVCQLFLFPAAVKSREWRSVLLLDCRRGRLPFCRCADESNSLLVKAEAPPPFGTALFGVLL